MLLVPRPLFRDRKSLETKQTQVKPNANRCWSIKLVNHIQPQLTRLCPNSSWTPTSQNADGAPLYWAFQRYEATTACALLGWINKMMSQWHFLVTSTDTNHNIDLKVRRQSHLPWGSGVSMFCRHNVSLTSYRLASLWFHVNWPSHSWDTDFQSLTLKIQGQGHSSRSQRRYTTLSIHILFVPCKSALPFLGYSYFKIWHWKFKVKVMGEVKV